MHEFIPESKMAAYMCEHGCYLLLVTDELREAYRGLVIHWRDLNGCWYAARWLNQDHQFDVAVLSADPRSGMPVAGSESHADGI